MIRLALDSASHPHSIALQKETEPMIVQSLSNPKQAAENLVSEIQSLLQQANTQLSDVNQLITTRGPGPFIGLRVGLAAMRGLALATHIPLWSISTLTLLASFLNVKPHQTILASMPAQKGFLVIQHFNHQYQPKNNMQTLSIKDFHQQYHKNDQLILAPDTPPKPLAIQLLRLAQKPQDSPNPPNPPNSPNPSLSSLFTQHADPLYAPSPAPKTYKIQPVING